MNSINTNLIGTDTFVIMVISLLILIALSIYWFVLKPADNEETGVYEDGINAPAFFDDGFVDYRNLTPATTTTYVHNEYGVALYGYRRPVGLYYVHPDGVKVISEDFDDPEKDIFRMPVEQLDAEYTAF